MARLLEEELAAPTFDHAARQAASPPSAPAALSTEGQLTLL
jgi:hypothetical protein